MAEAIRLDPKDARAYVARSTAYLLRKDYDLAIADAEEAIRLAPNSALGYLNRGAAYAGKKDYSAPPPTAREPSNWTQNARMPT